MRYVSSMTKSLHLKAHFYKFISFFDAPIAQYRKSSGFLNHVPQVRVLLGAPRNDVYFGTSTADIFEATSTSIKAYRPNLATDSCEVKVVSSTALLVAKYSKSTESILS